MVLHIGFPAISSRDTSGSVRFPATEIELPPETPVIVPSMLSGEIRATVEQASLKGFNKPATYLATPDGVTFHVRSGTRGEVLGFGHPNDPLKLSTMVWKSILPGIHVFAPSGEKDDDGQDVWRQGRAVLLATHEGGGVTPEARSSLISTGEEAGGAKPRGFAHLAGFASDGTPWWIFSEQEKSRDAERYPGGPLAPLGSQPAGFYVVELLDGQWSTADVP